MESESAIDAIGDNVIASRESRNFQRSWPHAGQSESPASLVSSGATAPQIGHTYGSPSGVLDETFKRELPMGPARTAEYTVRRRLPVIVRSELMSTVAVPRYTAAEYLAFERDSDTKHEFYRGELFAMSGGTGPHSGIASNIIRALGNALSDRPCIVHTSDLRVACPTGLYTYPDVSVVCGKVQYEDAANDVLLNPIVIVEVLSPSTEAYDRGAKFKHYRTIPSFREYVLVSQHEARVEHYSRQQDAAHWLLTTIDDPQGVVAFPALNCTIPMAEIYAKVEFGPETPMHDDGSGGRRPDR